MYKVKNTLDKIDYNYGFDLICKCGANLGKHSSKGYFFANNCSTPTYKGKRVYFCDDKGWYIPGLIAENFTQLMFVIANPSIVGMPFSK